MTNAGHHEPATVGPAPKPAAWNNARQQHVPKSSTTPPTDAASQKPTMMSYLRAVMRFFDQHRTFAARWSAFDHMAGGNLIKKFAFASITAAMLLEVIIVCLMREPAVSSVDTALSLTWSFIVAVPRRIIDASWQYASSIATSIANGIAWVMRILLFPLLVIPAVALFSTILISYVSLLLAIYWAWTLHDISVAKLISDEAFRHLPSFPFYALDQYVSWLLVTWFFPMASTHTYFPYIYLAHALYCALDIPITSPSSLLQFVGLDVSVRVPATSIEKQLKENQARIRALEASLAELDASGSKRE